MYSKIKHVKIGQILSVKDDAEFCKKGNTTRNYKVIAIYPFHVLAVNKNGIKRSFSHGHLIQMGYEKQKPEIEALKKSYDVEEHHFFMKGLLGNN